MNNSPCRITTPKLLREILFGSNVRFALTYDQIVILRDFLDIYINRNNPALLALRHDKFDLAWYVVITKSEYSKTSQFDLARNTKSQLIELITG